MTDYTKGEQPCKHYKPQMDGNEYAVWENAHECFGFRQSRDGAICHSTVSFCENCRFDHHEGGYETCGTKKVDDIDD